MPAIKYKPSADCAYTQLISKIKGVHEQAKPPSSSTSQQNAKAPPKTEQTTGGVEVKTFSNGLMLAQYYNSDSEDEEENQSSKETSHLSSQQQNESSQPSLGSVIPTLNPETPIPPEILCPPPELKAIIEKTASYVLKNGKEFEDILRTKNDQRFAFLQYTDPYYKYYTFKLTGIVCPALPVKTNTHDIASTTQKAKSSNDHETKTGNFDVSKPIGIIYILDGFMIYCVQMVI